MYADNVDKMLIENGDTRNVIDKYKNWKLEAIKEDMRKNAFEVHIAIENYQHDINIGTIVRNANAFNVAGVHIIGKKHWNKRGAMGTEKYLDVYGYTNIQDFIEWSTDSNHELIGIDNIPVSTNLYKTKLPKNCVLVFGQEGPGLSKELQYYCKEIVAIEQFGSTRSVNVGVASGIILYEWVRTWKL